MSYNIGFIIDGLILVFLSVTIFYAARLSLFLKSFREGREGMQTLIRDLSITIDKAETSIHTMKEHAKLTEEELRNIVNEAKALSEELQFMNTTGDSLATRLEKLADRNRELVDLMENAGGIGTPKIPDMAVSSAPVKPSKVEEEFDPFEISDFDMDESDMDEDDERDFMALGDGAYREDDIPQTRKDVSQHQPKVNTQAKSKVRSFAIFDRDYAEDIEEDEAQEPADSQFHSQAEQDLYEALQRRKKSANGAPNRVREVS